MSHCLTSPVSLCPHCVLCVPHTSLEKQQEGLGEGNEQESSEHRRVMAPSYVLLPAAAHPPPHSLPHQL